MCLGFQKKVKFSFGYFGNEMWWEEINSTKEVLEKSFSDIFEAFVAMTRYVQNATNPTPSRQKEFVLEKVIENLMIDFTNISAECFLGDKYADVGGWQCILWARLVVALLWIYCGYITPTRHTSSCRNISGK